MKVAYLGPRGTFSEEAATRYFKDADELLPRDSIPDVLESVHNGEADKCIVPIENSIAGTINMSVDGLLVYRLFIEADIIFPVSLNLVGINDSRAGDIKNVLSIAPALDQCRDYIRKKGFAYDRVDSTATAAQVVKEKNRPDLAAISSEWVAGIYGLKVLEKDIQDSACNHTRFIVISKNSIIQPNQEKTMLLVTPQEEYVGMLASILNVFSTLSINLTWIESRPTRKKLGTYRFFIETEAGYGEERMDKAITILRTFGHHVDVLGSYSTTTL